MASLKERSAKVSTRRGEVGIGSLGVSDNDCIEQKSETKDQSSPYLFSWLMNVNVFLAGFRFPTGFVLRIKSDIVRTLRDLPSMSPAPPSSPGTWTRIISWLQHRTSRHYFLGALTGSLLHFVPLSLHLLIAEWRKLKYWQDCLCWKYCLIVSGGV